MPPDASHPWQQVLWLVVLALPVASVSWTVTHEELFRELREACGNRSQTCRRLLQRKFFYILTCEFCFSHYVTIAFIALTRYRLLLDDWRGFVIAFFAVAGMANLYLSLFGRLRVDIKAERLEIASLEQELQEDSREPSLPGRER
jgi:hypothetical protein